MKLNYRGPLFCTVLFGAITLFNSGCKSYDDVASRYTSKHIKANTNQIAAQIPETGELGYILLALTDVGTTDTSLINKDTQYYKEVIAHFNGFKNHKIVKQLNKDLQGNINNFTHFRNGLYAFKLNDRNRMVLKTDYRIDLNRVDFRRYTTGMQDFIASTKFREFYAKHKDLYTKIIQNQSSQLTMNAAWATMGKQYTEPFQSYQVIMSPLMRGNSSTLAISGRGFRECLIFAESADKALLYTAAKPAVGKGSFNE
ncbi:DUF4932 domain-containing protein [Mucilaginibacter terrae]|uniref:DUF4932 domain-containing protein n=1 Tax=Mucilaginibacter terrae TaxID=1955052 RepID=UPI00362E7AE6